MMRRRAALLLFALLAAPSITTAQEAQIDADIVPAFVEEAATAGIDHVYGGPWEFFVGGGVAAFDCDQDRRPDLFLAGGAEPSHLYRNVSPTGGALRFESVDLTEIGPWATDVLGAYPLDIDGDGLLDLVLLRLGENVLLKGDGACGFHPANELWHFDGGNEWTTAFSATWEAGSVFPTLAFGNYVDETAPGAPWGTCADNVLYRPERATEGPDYSGATILTPGYCALSMLFTDWNSSGAASLRIANDRQYYRGGEEQMWRLDPGAAPVLYTAADGWEHLSIWGMGIAEGDLNGDGFPEYVLTSMGDTKLQMLVAPGARGTPTYQDMAFERGATAHRPYVGDDRRPSTGWHAEFADVNNDGLLDLFVAKGNVEAMPEFAQYDPDNLLLGRWDETFVEAGAVAGIALDRVGRGAALVDLNLDGMLDLVVVNRNGPASVFRNQGVATDWGGHAPMGNWLEVELLQDDGNPLAVGARISVKTGTRTMNRTIEVGGGHASGHIGFVHIGIGTAERAEIRVRWPDGEWSHAYRVFANNFVQIERGADAARYWFPPPG